jgi:hypothetical protein
MIRLSASHSHLYPGARGRVLAAPSAGGAALLDFADGAHALGQIEDGILHVGAYYTAAGTAIGAKSWHVDLGGDSFRIIGRAGPDAPPKGTP